MKDDLKAMFKDGSNLNWIVFINLSVFLLIKLAQTLFFLFNSSSAPVMDLVFQLAIPASIGALIHQPWSLITYMFTHEGFFHILFNMLWLYWMGKILLEFLSEKKLLSIYIMGGLSGAFFYIAAFNLLPVFADNLTLSRALGASAGVLAIAFAAATLAPGYKINLLFIGAVQLKYLAVVMLIIDIISIQSSNAGGHLAHIGGAIYGYAYITLLRKGTDLGKPVEYIFTKLSGLFKKSGKMKIIHRKTRSDEVYNADKLHNQQVIDRILDKIAASGYDSLNEREKSILFNYSKKENTDKHQ